MADPHFLGIENDAVYRCFPNLWSESVFSGHVSSFAEDMWHRIVKKKKKLNEGERVRMLHHIREIQKASAGVVLLMRFKTF